MPAWWLPKARSKAKAKSKARSFDEAAAPPSISPRESSGSLFSFDSDVDRRVCHPLPRPGVGVVADQGSTGASASISSVSSSGSSEETPDLAVYRYSEPVNMPRGRSVTPDSKRQNHVGEDNHNQLLSCSPVLEHQRLANIRISPRKNVTAHGFDNLLNGTAYAHRAVSSEHVFSPGSRSPGPGSRSPGPRSPGPRSRGYTLPTSPVGSRVFSASSDTTGKQDDLRSASHPLPLPPTSPTSPASRSFQSKWKKGKLLGRGTFGHVYAGFNSENGQMCAIKEVEVISDDSNSKECLKQLSQEINLLSQLSHPNIVQYYGSELVDDTLSVFLEYVSGGSIHKLLQDYGPFGEPVIRSYTGQILSGLAYLHGRNTIHRDIKGANILVDPNGEIKLADFGMAKHISSYSSIRSFKGSPYWMAPEVIMNSSGYSLAVDIWSLGCTIIEMASAKPPWNQFTGVQAIFKIGNSKDIPEIPDHLSNDAKNFLKLCLQRDPSSRQTAAQLMDHPFVRDQTKTKIASGNAVRDAYSSLPDGSRSPTANDVAANRSISPLQDRDYTTRPTLGYSNYKPKSDLVVRMNMSLPVSPCSSPLRQFRQSNWSCLPSPPHPAYALGAAGLGTSSLYPLGHSSRYTDHLPDMAVVNGPTLFSSPRR